MKSRKMRGTGIFLMACMLFLCLPVSSLSTDGFKTADRGYSPTIARESAAQYESAVDIMTLDSAVNTFNEDTWYKIEGADGLVLFSELVNRVSNESGENRAKLKYIKVCLACDIDMSSVKGFTAIGNGTTKYTSSGLPSTRYYGTFDGCGYRIDNLNVTVTETDKSTQMLFLSLFGVLDSAATVKNLVIGENCRFSYTGESEYACTAAVAGRVLEGATVENILSLASVSGGCFSGGLIARIDAGEGRTALANAAVVSNCSNAGDVNGSDSAGGLIGACHGNALIRSCRNTGKISASGRENASAGGLLGKAGKAYDYSGGEAWSFSPNVSVNLENTANYGNILSSRSGGGLIGFADNGSDGSVTVTLGLNDCLNEGNALRPFLGGATTDRQITLSNCNDRSAEVRLHGSQVRSVDTETNTYAVRFVGSMGSLDYEEIGFYVTVTLENGSTLEPLRLHCRYAFKTMLAGEDGLVYTAAELRGGEDPYLYALTVEGIPADSGRIVFHVTPYGIRNGSDTPEAGETFDITYRNGSFVPAWEG